MIIPIRTFLYPQAVFDVGSIQILSFLRRQKLATLWKFLSSLKKTLKFADLQSQNFELKWLDLML